MSTPSAPLNRAFKPFSIRRQVDRKVLRFSLWIGALAVLLAALVYAGAVYPSLRRARETNLRALSEIKCKASGCDASEFTTDWQREAADYVVDTGTGYLLNTSVPPEEKLTGFAPLDFSDIAFIERFRQPDSYSTPDGEEWRLYSQAGVVDGRRLEIFVGYAEQAAWKMIETPRSLIPTIDAKLKSQSQQIIEAVSAARGIPLRAGRSTPKLSLDGFEIVDAETRRVVEMGSWLPSFLPKEVALPRRGGQLYVNDEDLYFVRTDTDDRLSATTLVELSNLWWFGFIGVVAFVGASIAARVLSRRFLRNYFALTSVRLPELAEACRSGEGQNIEFKRGLSDDEMISTTVEDELLKSIAAFANTNDGVIFIGVDDSGNIRGLKLNFNQRDRLERKVRQLTRTRIRPIPPIQIAFEEVRGLAVAKIAVARGEAPAYLLNGVIYLRDGSSDVQAQPEQLNRLIAEFAS